jgi:Family of unknown function (DUF6599)
MRRFGWILGLLAFAAGPPAAAQGMLPSSFGGWNATDSPVVNLPASFNQLLGQDAAIFREYSLKSVERGTYTQGGRTAEVKLFRFRDPSSAYGGYTFLRTDALSAVKIGSFGSVSGDHALIVVGNYLLEVGGHGTRPSNDALAQLAQDLDKRADDAPFPTIGGHLPEEGFVRRSEHYVLGPAALARQVPLGGTDWVGFDRGAEAIVASYRLAGGKVKLLIVSYPTQQIAAEQLAGMMRQFDFDPPGDIPADKVVLFGKRSSSMIAIVVGAPTRRVANSLLDQVYYVDQVTWNEPRQTLTDPSISNMVVGAFMGTGAIMLLALAAGLGFGGIRLLLKIFLPNKVFDRESQIEILQLGISSKPIQAKDFY